MKRIHIILVALSLSASFVSCDKPKSFPCNIWVTKSADAFSDSLSVYCFERDYLKVRLVYEGRVIGDTLHIAENCNEMVPRVGFFKVGNDSAAHYFVIEPGELGINITKQNVVMQGYKSNRKLIELRSLVERIQDAKMRNRADYMKMVEDSTLTADFEKSCFAKDSILTDSLQNTIVNGCSFNDAVRMIVKEQYANVLKPENMSKIE